MKHPAVWLFALLPALLAFGPCGVIRGTALSQPEATEPVRDWSFANEVPRCAVEVRRAAPYSVTVNCMSLDRELFVSCSRCQGKTWSGFALGEREARIRVGERVYPVFIDRVISETKLDAVWKARARKLGGDQAEPRPDGWWTFRLVSR